MTRSAGKGAWPRAAGPSRWSPTGSTGTPCCGRLPVWVARLVAGEHGVALMTEARGASNAKARRELGWRPAHPSWRQGFAEVASRATTQHAA